MTGHYTLTNVWGFLLTSLSQAKPSLSIKVPTQRQLYVYGLTAGKHNAALPVTDNTVAASLSLLSITAYGTVICLGEPGGAYFVSVLDTLIYAYAYAHGICKIVYRPFRLSKPSETLWIR